ncbi:MAG: AmmeMemoRadiSam system radical SAM enzyme [Candidatus Nealsonbacteria bacterium]
MNIITNWVKIKQMKEAHLYQKFKDKAVKCQNCAHYCTVLPDKRGICGVRENINGEFYALNYGKLVACQIDPIEKKPLYHFLSGTYSLSIAAAGCNFACLNCQNWQISQNPKPQKSVAGENVEPKEIVEMALKNNLPSISYTYTEPAIFSEYALDIMKIARQNGLKNVWVTNGFWSKELFDTVSPYLDAVNVDLKSFEENFYKKICQGRLEPVLDTLKGLKKKNIWIEITTLVLPGLNDQEKTFKDIAGFIKKELGSETPWHVSRFFQDVSWRLKDLPDTSTETIKKACRIGKEAGLKNVYAGNM